MKQRDSKSIIKGFVFSEFKAFNELSEEEQDYYNNIEFEELEECDDAYVLHWWLRVKIGLKYYWRTLTQLINKVHIRR